MSKITKIPSKIRSFFSEKCRSSTMDAFTRLVENINLDSRSLGGIKRENCQLTNLLVFQILLLLPFFAVMGFSHYGSSVLHSMFGGKKDVFYSFMSQDTINWRKLIYRISNWLITKVVVRNDYKIFFCKRGNEEGWKVLLTTDLRIGFMRAYEIYAMRWAIVSLVLIRYNLLASMKRTLDYEIRFDF